MTYLFHNSQNSNFREPFGATSKGSFTSLAIEASLDFDWVSIQIKYIDIDGNETFNELQMDVSIVNDKKIFTYKVSLDKAGVCFYRFKGFSNCNIYYYLNNDDCLGGIGKISSYEEEKYFQITVTERNLTIPMWFRKSVMYQIFPDRFAKGYDATVEDKKNAFYYSSWDDNPMYIRKEGTTEIERWDFHRGNLSGISEKLPYLEAIGANLLYLNPIFSARSNHRYDTCDYKHVDGLLGGDPAFDLLTYVAGKDGVKIMLDGVFSHTGSDSIYFDKYGKYGTGAYKNQNSKYRNWYRFKSSDDEEYECWWGVKDLPNVDELNPDYKDFIADGDDSVIKHWIRKGVCGFRLDVCDELPDEFIRSIRNAADEASSESNNEAVLLGEVWEDASNKISYNKLRSYLTSKELHTVTNYPFRKNLLDYFNHEIDGKYLVKLFNSMKENYPEANFNALVNMTGSHDVSRLMTEFLKVSDGNKAKARKYVKMYATVMFTFPGVPMVYYGDETCLEGGVDPDNRRTYPWGNEDVNMITHFANLALQRKKNDVFVLGDTTFLEVSNNGFGYIRKYGDKEALVVMQDSPIDNVTVTIEGLKPNAKYSGQNGTFITDENGKLEIEILGGIGVFTSDN